MKRIYFSTAVLLPLLLWAKRRSCGATHFRQPKVRTTVMGVMGTIHDILRIDQFSLQRLIR